MMKIAGIMNDIYFFRYKNLLITDRLVVKPCWLFCRKFARVKTDSRLLTYVRRNSYVVALGKIMLKLP